MNRKNATLILEQEHDGAIDGRLQQSTVMISRVPISDRVVVLPRRETKPRRHLVADAQSLDVHHEIGLVFEHRLSEKRESRRELRGHEQRQLSELESRRVARTGRESNIGEAVHVCVLGLQLATESAREQHQREARSGSRAPERDSHRRGYSVLEGEKPSTEMTLRGGPA